MRWLTAVLAVLLGIVAGAGPAWAGRCGTGRHEVRETRFQPLPPVARSAGPSVFRTVAPIPTTANVYLTEHFRVLWGDNYSAQQPRWQDPDGSGPRPPSWVEILGTALEDAYTVQTGLGFPEPYGVDSCVADPVEGCYIDAYVGNTGVIADGTSVTIGSSFYAITEIDVDYQVAYFTFNFNIIGSEGVLRATAAHELFHAVQRAMDYPWNDESAETGISWLRWNREGWWLEATATWMEEETFPEVDDYISYVNDFLAEPQMALDSQDGLHEYGAAVFAGYLWNLYGGADLIRTAYENAYDLELEPALRAALSGQGAGQLEDVVAAFWARAADPVASVWADAAQFQDAMPLTGVSQLPTSSYPSSWERPGRFGANLIRLDAGLLPTTATVEWSDTANPWRLALRPGALPDVTVATPVSGGTLPLDGAGSGSAYLAVVNVSSTTDARDYTVEIGGGGVVDGAVQWRSVAAPATDPEASSGGGSGGCFLGSLGL